MGRKALELRGKVFGRWVVLRPSKKRKRHWVCKCDCGTEREVFSGTLTKGMSLSCGCLRFERLKNRTDYKKHEMIERDYLNGKSCREISLELGVSKQRIHEILCKRGIQLRARGRGSRGRSDVK